MPIVLNIPPSIEKSLQGGSDRPLDAEALEYAAVEWYRQGRLFHSQFAKLLGISRYDADAVLKRHEVLDEFSATEILEQVRRSRELEGQ